MPSPLPFTTFAVPMVLLDDVPVGEAMSRVWQHMSRYPVFHLVVGSAADGPEVTGMAIYGSSLVLLFFASSLYHFVDLGDRRNGWPRRLDHAAIYLLIAGTYVPALLHLLDGAWRISMLSVVGGLAVAGVAFKLVWFEAPDWLSTAAYLALGWVVVIPAYRILPAHAVAHQEQDGG